MLGIRISNRFKSLVTRNFSYLKKPSSSRPLIETYRNTWPDVEYKPSRNILSTDIPVRTVPDECLRFRIKSTFTKGSSIYFPVTFLYKILI